MSAQEVSRQAVSRQAVGTQEVDVLFAGGGLASVLAACRLAERRPDLRLAVLEQGPALGGNHTWCLHDSDLSAADRAWLQPFVARRWAGQEVRFPGQRRVLDTGYAMLTPASLAAGAAALPRAAVHTGTRIAELTADGARTADGHRFRAGCVIDGRGPMGRPTGPPGLAVAFQAFLGLELELAAPHGLHRPVLMDATVAQHGGFRFMYVLPLSDTALLVEDTVYADTPDHDPVAAETAIHAYCDAQGWRVTAERRREQAALPIVLAGDPARYFAAAGPEVGLIGLRGLFFHPLTGYSLPDAVRTAGFLAALPAFDTAAVAAALRARSCALWRERWFLRLLARMMFVGAPPAGRRRIMQRFYALPQGLIERFYAGSPSAADRVRILAGRPPIALHRAAASLPPAAGFRFAAARQVADG